MELKNCSLIHCEDIIDIEDKSIKVPHRIDEEILDLNSSFGGGGLGKWNKIRKKAYLVCVKQKEKFPSAKEGYISKKMFRFFKKWVKGKHFEVRERCGSFSYSLPKDCIKIWWWGWEDGDTERTLEHANKTISEIIKG